MAKRVIVLTRSSDGTTQNISAAFWYPITSGAQAVTQNSAWSGASAAENTAIQNGSVIEEVRSFSFPVGQGPTDIKDVLLQAWNERDAQISGIGPAIYQGVYNDSSTGWSA